MQPYFKYTPNYTDSYPFGMLMPDRNGAVSGTDYRYGFNGQEQETEISNSNSHTSAEYWMYDSRLGRRWNIDPKPDFSISPYATFANNPIMFSDHDGDTIKYTAAYNKAYRTNKTFRQAARNWKETEEGKSFIKDYSPEGKYGKVTVEMDVNYDGTNTTDAYGVDKATGERRLLQPKDYDVDIDQTKLNPNEYLLFRVTISVPYINKEGDYMGGTPRRHTKESAEKANINAASRTHKSHLHERQHVRIETADILKDGVWNIGPYWQHIEMKDKNKRWYQERRKAFLIYHPSATEKEIEKSINSFYDY